MTRQHHPLEGQELEVVRDGKSMLIVMNPDAFPMRIERTWTDVDGAVAGSIPRDTQLTIAALRDLLHLVHVLGRRS